MALLDGMETLGVVLLYYSSRCRWGQEEEERRGGGGGGRERERLKVKGGTRDVVGLVVDSLPKTFRFGRLVPFPFRRDLTLCRTSES